MSSYVPAALRRFVAQRAHGLCEYCLIHEDDTFLGCQVEHIIAEKHGGQTVESNLAFACVFCNRFKGSDIATLAQPSSRLCRLFNPRIDRWADHFLLDVLHIVGRTEIGQATATLLCFNNVDRLLERHTLAAENRYPSGSARQLMQKD